MGKGRILRVLEGTVLPPEIINALGELWPDYVPETYHKTPDYNKSIIRRIDSLHNAFSFVLEAYPLDANFTPFNAETLKTYAAECRAACNLKLDSMDELHKELEKFTAKLIELIATNWSWPEGKSVKEAINTLNEAECYQIMMNHGRPDIATLTVSELGNEKQYVLQVDESIPPYYDQLIQELLQIKEHKYPKTPSWFVKLPEYQQAYFCNLTLDTISPAEVVQDLKKFIEAWQEIKTQSLSLTTELKQIQKGLLPLPAWFNGLSLHLKEMVKILALKPESFKENLDKFKSMVVDNANKSEFKQTLQTVTKIPQWYWVLSSRQQYFFEHVLKNSETLEDAVTFISSRDRTKPLPSNLGAHSLITINPKGESTIHYGKRVRSSHIATRDGLKYPAAVQERHSDSNLTKIMENTRSGAPFLLQTLISPIHAVDYVPGMIADYLPELPPDLELYKLARAAVARSSRSIDIWQHNHPFNMAKLLYYTTADNPDSLFILETAQKYVTRFPGLQKLLDDYKNVLESPMGSATILDYNGRELFLSSLEQLIMLTLGGASYGSCVSGKDRKAIELIHTDAMILYNLRYGAWPNFQDPTSPENRVRFVNIVADLYVSRHQQELAGQNAPGADGIKTPWWYFPADIVEAINKRVGSDRALERDDQLATYNEVKYIPKDLKSYLSTEHELTSKLMARQLGEETCKRLYDALSLFINEKPRFQKNGDWRYAFIKKEDMPSPTGIDLIRTIMGDEHAGNNTQRFEKIFAVVLSRPESDPTRTKATNSVYNRIRNLFKPLKSNPESHTPADEAVKEWEDLFKMSKVANTYKKGDECREPALEGSTKVTSSFVF